MAPGYPKKMLREGCSAQQVEVVGVESGPLTGDVVYTVRHANGRTSRWLRPADQNIPDLTGTRIATLG